MGDAKSQGQVEIDFHGAFVNENLAGVLLRQLTGKHETIRFVCCSASTGTSSRRFTRRLARGFGIDDPRDVDLLFGRSYNRFIFANVSFDLADKLTTGIEVTSWKTLYREAREGLVPNDLLIDAEPGEAVTIDWMVKYAF